MKPTKYRAWGTVDKKWMDDDCVRNQPIWMLQATESRYVFVEWTGLNGVNDEPVYEGSIVKGGIDGYRHRDPKKNR